MPHRIHKNTICLNKLLNYYGRFRVHMYISTLYHRKVYEVMYRIEHNFKYMFLAMSSKSHVNLGKILRKGLCNSNFRAIFNIVSTKSVWTKWTKFFMYIFNNGMQISCEFVNNPTEKGAVLTIFVLFSMSYFWKFMKLYIEVNQTLYICFWLWITCPSWKWVYWHVFKY